MATPKSVSAADLVPHSKLKVTALAPHGSDGTGLDEILAAPTAVGVAVGVAKRHATDLSPCQLNLWVLFVLSFAAIFLFTFSSFQILRPFLCGSAFSVGLSTAASATPPSSTFGPLHSV